MINVYKKPLAKVSRPSTQTQMYRFHKDKKFIKLSSIYNTEDRKVTFETDNSNARKMASYKVS